MSRAAFAALIICAAVVASGARAAEATPTAADPVLEARVNALAAELRCLVCQNQSLADSHAELAIDLKNQVREQMRSGRTDRQIVDYMTERYGDFVLYRPPFKATTLLLWAGPALLLLAALALFVRALRARTLAAPSRALSDDEHERATALLGGADNAANVLPPRDGARCRAQARP